jgi:hypothetical protein
LRLPLNTLLLQVAEVAQQNLQGVEVVVAVVRVDLEQLQVFL